VNAWQDQRQETKMRAVLTGLGVAALAAVTAVAQTPVSFEAADVHVNPPTMSPNQGVRPGAIRNGVYEIGNATMLDLIRIAYRVEADKVLGGPSWLEVDKYNVFARVPPGLDFETARPLLATLLADRFKLVVREAKQDMNTWVLSEVTPGSAKLLRAQSVAIAPSCQGGADGPNFKAACRSQSMIGFLNGLPGVARSYGVTAPITNNTNLQGQWDFDIAFTQDREQLKELGAKGISLFDALEQQLGLKLEQKTISTHTYTVVSVNRTPTPNAAGIEKILPPRPAPEFEVVDVKLSPPGDGPMRAQIQPTGAINATRVPLREMINIAWGLSGNDLVVGPKFIDETKYDLVGKAFSGVNAQFVDDEFLRRAVQKLIVDRFKMTFHFEERPVPAYALLAGGTHKMTRADPAARTRCFNGVPPGARDPRQANPSRGGLMTCQNATMAFFLERLRGAAGGYIQAPPVDMTGLEGGWDFTLNWSAIGLFPGGVNGMGGRAAGDGPAGAAPSVPTGAITLPEAIESQLGLKFEMGRRPTRVLVIDSISEDPGAN
jgi:uncharacterized protein (TIGR03435 family)